MRNTALAVLLAASVGLVACGDGADNVAKEAESTAPVAQETASTAPAAEESSMLPVESDAPSAFPGELPAAVESTNTDEAWDDWPVDEMPSPDEVEGTVRLLRFEFLDDEQIKTHIRIGAPVDLVGDEDVDFCEEGPVPAEVVGFGNNWQAERSEYDGFIVCDTTAEFSLDEWGEAAMAPKPTLEDGTWNVQFGETFQGEDTAGMFRLRMEFGADVVEASDGGRVSGKAVTWDDTVPMNAKANAS